MLSSYLPALGRALLLLLKAILLSIVPRLSLAQSSCDALPTVYDCDLILLSGLEGTACPKGDIPYGAFLADCQDLGGEVLTLFGESDESYAYEYSSPPISACSELPDFFGPSTVGDFQEAGPGCPIAGANCGMGIAGSFSTKFCYRFKHYEYRGSVCDVHSDLVTMGTLDLVGGGSRGFVDAGDLAALAALLGTRCGYYSGSGAKYNPIADFNKDEFIDGSDLALFAQHVGHGCQDWMGSAPKATIDVLPYFVFDMPEMQSAMRIAGVNRDFVLDVWRRNGAAQRLFYKALRTIPSLTGQTSRRTRLSSGVRGHRLGFCIGEDCAI